MATLAKWRTEMFARDVRNIIVKQRVIFMTDKEDYLTKKAIKTLEWLTTGEQGHYL